MLSPQTSKRRTTAAKTTAAAKRRTATASAQRKPTEAAGAKLDAAQRTLRQVGAVAARFARHSVKQVSAAAGSSRAPMKSIWRSVSRAGRSIARDATAAWHEVAPAKAKPAAASKRKSAA